MEPYVYWLILALLLAGLEMATGTFYMLVLSIAAALGGVVALAGLALTMQMVAAGLAAVIGTVVLRQIKGSRPAPADNNFDIGQQVRVLTWNADGTARVHYRGAEWDGELESSQTPHGETLYIKAIQGSKLILTQHKP
jgi:membrane protein implicated in regulation of membrane protease activity